MKFILTLFATFAVVSVLLVASCSSAATTATSSTSTATSTQQGDDVIGTPGGYAYRADIQEGDQTISFPPIETTSVNIGSGTVTYRADIQTTPGTTRNNIVNVHEMSTVSPPTPLQLNVTLSLNSLPAGSGVTASIGEQGFSPDTTETILSFNIAAQAGAGDYQFTISVTVDGVNWGTLPCTVHVTA